MNTVLVTVSVCLLEWNISIPAYFGVPFYIVSEFPANIYLYIYIYIYKITIILTLTNELNREV